MRLPGSVEYFLERNVINNVPDHWIGQELPDIQNSQFPRGLDGMRIGGCLAVGAVLEDLDRESGVYDTLVLAPSALEACFSVSELTNVWTSGSSMPMERQQLSLFVAGASAISLANSFQGIQRENIKPLVAEKDTDMFRRLTTYEFAVPHELKRPIGMGVARWYAGVHSLSLQLRETAGLVDVVMSARLAEPDMTYDMAWINFMFETAALKDLSQPDLLWSESPEASTARVQFFETYGDLNQGLFPTVSQKSATQSLTGTVRTIAGWATALEKIALPKSAPAFGAYLL